MDVKNRSLRAGLGWCVASVPLPSDPNTGSNPGGGRVLKKKKAWVTFVFTELCLHIGVCQDIHSCSPPTHTFLQVRPSPPPKFNVKQVLDIFDRENLNINHVKADTIKN